MRLQGTVLSKVFVKVRAEKVASCPENFELTAEIMYLM